MQRLLDVEILAIPYTENFHLGARRPSGAPAAAPEIAAPARVPQMHVLMDIIEAGWEAAASTRRTALKVMFCDVKAKHLPCVIEALKRLEKRSETGCRVVLISFD